MQAQLDRRFGAIGSDVRYLNQRLAVPAVLAVTEKKVRKPHRRRVKAIRC